MGRCDPSRVPPVAVRRSPTAVAQTWARPSPARAGTVPAMTASLRQAFVAALDESVREAFLAYPALDEQLEAMVHAAAEARGPLGVSPTELVAHVARVAGTKTDPAALGSLRAADLYLACACAAGL